ncbi:hypothetical protein JD844_028044 [Phrynosoma platyrhinos]|uniref:VWFD domain-containing protein n=1 Tax=Phrynosoma platyrhinos TaxID=52577 RepID=A0ABQ7SHA5_PHRPL|nr:hypothetical protein JD844_028044 [Phrynosoma platyrhinos]
MQLTFCFAGSCRQDCLNGAVCTEAGMCDCETFQAQGERCQTVANGGKDRDGICKSWGQYHYETFDGIYYYFPGNCSYIFVKDCGDPEPQYTVWNIYCGKFCFSLGDYKEDIAKFANSWSVQTPDDAACVATASDFPSPCNIDAESYEDIYFKCQILLQFPFFSCHQSIDPYPYISSCMNDLCR